MKALLCLGLIGIWVLSVLALAQFERLPEQLKKQNEGLHQSKSFGKHGSQIIKTWKKGSAIKVVKDKRRASLRDSLSRETELEQTSERASRRVSGIIPAGNFGGEVKKQGLSKARIKRFKKFTPSVPKEETPKEEPIGELPSPKGG